MAAFQKGLLHYLITFCAIITSFDVSAVSLNWWSSVAQLGAHVQLSPIPDREPSPDPNGSPHESHYESGDAAAPGASFLQPAPMACGSLTGLSPGQRSICQLFYDHMPAVGLGTRRAIEECQHQFRDSRWNCSSPYGAYGPVHIYNTREAAFTYAIIAAGVAHQISRACRLGQLGTCACGGTGRPNGLPPSWQWSGCGDNLRYGYDFAKGFIDVREREYNFEQASPQFANTLANRWNNEVGRKLLLHRSGPHCRCNGVSGSCTMRTCWLQLPTIRQLGTALANKYAEARRVRMNENTGHLQVVSVRRFGMFANEKVDAAAGAEKHAGGTQTTLLAEQNSSLTQPSPSIQQKKLSIQSDVDLLRVVQQHEGDEMSNVNETHIQPVFRYKRQSAEPRAWLHHGQRLHRRSESQSQSQITHRKQPRRLHNRRKNGRRRREKNRVRKFDLVYLHDSPDYCHSDRNLATLGTQGRVCTPSGHGADSCAVLCCGRGYHTYTEVGRSKCRCNFVWCCKVQCDWCEQVTVSYVCK